MDHAHTEIAQVPAGELTFPPAIQRSLNAFLGAKSPGCRVAVKVLCTLMCNGGWSEAGIESTKKKKKKTCKLPDVSSGRCLA